LDVIVTKSVSSTATNPRANSRDFSGGRRARRRRLPDPTTGGPGRASRPGSAADAAAAAAAASRVHGRLTASRFTIHDECVKDASRRPMTGFCGIFDGSGATSRGINMTRLRPQSNDVRLSVSHPRCCSAGCCCCCNNVTATIQNRARDAVSFHARRAPPFVTNSRATERLVTSSSQLTHCWLPI